MCKCCQNCLESCYWHCFEKWFFDDNIALYEDPQAEQKERRSYDNVAFWDSVAVIANRAVVTIQPLPNKNTDETIKQIGQPGSKGTNFEKQRKKTVTDFPGINKITKPETPPIKSSIKINVTEATPDKEKSNIRKQSAIVELIESRGRSESNAEEKLRKKSLKERRKSAAGLTLKLDNDFHEIPVIRQSSMPRFFIETPDIDSKHGNYSGERSSVLVSPVIGNSPTFSYDLKSIVQIENELKANSKPCTPKSNRSSRLTQVKKKLKPISIKKQKSLPDGINHM